MAKYNVKKVRFKQAMPEVGGSAWMADIKQGGITSVEFDSTERMLTMLTAVEKHRIPVENVSSMVYGMTSAANSARGQSTD